MYIFINNLDVATKKSLQKILYLVVMSLIIAKESYKKRQNICDYKKSLINVIDN
jgi:hypothetical protein